MCHPPPPPAPAPWPCGTPERLAFAERQALLEAVQEIQRLEAENAYTQQALANAVETGREWRCDAMDARRQLAACAAAERGPQQAGAVVEARGVERASFAPVAGAAGSGAADAAPREVAVPYPVTVRSLIDLFA